MENTFCKIMELVEEFTEDFLSKIEKSVIKAVLSNNKKLSEIYCEKTNCVNIIEHNGRYICNQKCITINKVGKCLFSNIVDELKKNLPSVE